MFKPKPLLLNSYDVGGAARAVLRLNKGLQSIGIESQVQVQFQSKKLNGIESPQMWQEKFAARLKIYLDALPVRFYKKRPLLNFTPAFVPDTILKRIDRLKPDIIHLNWMANGFLRLENLKKFNRPLVWTLHDSWAFTGGCHTPFGCTKYCQCCGACPVLGSNNEYDLSRWVHFRKRRAWKDLNLTIVTPSNWLADCARSSSLFRNNYVQVIPNGLDTSVFMPYDKSLARQFLHLPINKKIILFGAKNATTDRNKGYHNVLESLEKLATKSSYEFVIFGSSHNIKTHIDGINIHHFGVIDDDTILSKLYSAADVMVVPSIQESFGQTASEAMSCGTPVVAFATTGLIDIIDHQQNGFLARPYDTGALADGIEWIFNEIGRSNSLSLLARKKAEAVFSIEHVASQYAELYDECMRK